MLQHRLENHEAQHWPHPFRPGQVAAPLDGEGAMEFEPDRLRPHSLAYIAHDAFVASQLPGPIRTVLKPLGNAGLGVNLAIHHRNIGLIAGGNNFFQTELTVAKQGDESNEHAISIHCNYRQGLTCSVRAKPGRENRFRKSIKGLSCWGFLP
jgi:hypothetical protein